MRENCSRLVWSWDYLELDRMLVFLPVPVRLHQTAGWLARGVLCRALCVCERETVCAIVWECMCVFVIVCVWDCVCVLQKELFHFLAKIQTEQRRDVGQTCATIWSWLFVRQQNVLVQAGADPTFLSGEMTPISFLVFSQHGSRQPAFLSRAPQICTAPAETFPPWAHLCWPSTAPRPVEMPACCTVCLQLQNEQHVCAQPTPGKCCVVLPLGSLERSTWLVPWKAQRASSWRGARRGDVSILTGGCSYDGDSRVCKGGQFCWKSPGCHQIYDRSFRHSVTKQLFCFLSIYF